MKEFLLFSAAWCGPCKAAKKALDAISVPYQGVDIDDPEKMPLTASYGIRGIPTMLVLEDGKEIARLNGNIAESVKQFL